MFNELSDNLHGTPAILTIPVLTPCLRAEQIHITIDTHTGMLHCHVPKHLNCPLIPELQHALNNDLTKLPNLVSELRFWITQRRCEKTLQHLPATPHERLPILHTPDHPVAKIGKHKVYVKLNRYPNVILIVELKEKPSYPNEVEFAFYLAIVKMSSIEVEPTPGEETIENEITKMYLKVSTLIEFDTFVATHGPGTYVDDGMSNKRRANDTMSLGPASKQIKTIYPAYFMAELAHVVAMCDEKLPFVSLAQEVSSINRDNAFKWVKLIDLFCFFSYQSEKFHMVDYKLKQMRHHWF